MVRIIKKGDIAAKAIIKLNIIITYNLSYINILKGVYN